MRRIDYVHLIKEDADTLLAEEKASSQGKIRQRLQLLRLLKSGQAETMEQVSTLVGMTKDHAAKLFQRYRREGLEKFTRLNYKGRRSYLTRAQEEHLQSAAAPHFHTLAEGQMWIAEQYKVSYRISGVSVLFERLQTKKKTGRTAHHKQDLEAQEAFKKNL